MSRQSFRLRLRFQPTLRLEMGGLTPLAVANCSAAELARWPLWHGNQSWPLGEFFDLTPLGGADAADVDAPTLHFEGELSRCDGFGRGLDGGRLRIDGDVGDSLGAGMSAGEIMLSGSAGLLAGCAMKGGKLEVGGNVGDYAASALPGDMDGMSGGLLIVRGNAGARFGDRMRRGTALIYGSSGDFLASRLVAGSIAVGGPVGAHCGYGMRRGSLVFAGEAPPPPATFAPTGHDFSTFWGLFARSLARHGGPFAALPGWRPRRLVGDLAADGRGEWLLPG